MNQPTIVLGADHGGFDHKTQLLLWLKELGYSVVDAGATTLDPEDDYPVYARTVGEKIQELEGDGKTGVGILLCRSGAGMVMAANRLQGIRAVAASTTVQAEHSRLHNDANVLVLSGDWTPLEEMKQLIQAFLQTPFSHEPRHERRIAQLDSV